MSNRSYTTVCLATEESCMVVIAALVDASDQWSITEAQQAKQVLQKILAINPQLRQFISDPPN